MSVLQQIIEPRRNMYREVLRRGIRSGELRADLDIEALMAMLISPMVVQNLLHWRPSLDTATLPERLLDLVWPAITA